MNKDLAGASHIGEDPEPGVRNVSAYTFENFQIFFIRVPGLGPQKRRSPPVVAEATTKVASRSGLGKDVASTTHRDEPLSRIPQAEAVHLHWPSLELQLHQAKQTLEDPLNVSDPRLVEPK
jgi:hypothetical protein